MGSGFGHHFRISDSITKLKMLLTTCGTGTKKAHGPLKNSMNGKTQQHLLFVDLQTPISQQRCLKASITCMSKKGWRADPLRISREGSLKVLSVFLHEDLLVSLSVTPFFTFCII